MVLRARHEDVIELYMVGRYSGSNGADHPLRRNYFQDVN
jgi:hypothetical protein